MAGNFAINLSAAIARAGADIDLATQKIAIDVFAAVIKKTPVGNPSLWKINQQAVSYNDAVSAENFRLRQDVNNRTRSGRLKKGLKINDSMALSAGANYTGGHARANWICSKDSSSEEVIDGADKSGLATISRMKAVVQTCRAGGVVFLSNNLPYIGVLEYGRANGKPGSTQAPNGMLRITVAEYEAHVNNALGGR